MRNWLRNKSNEEIDQQNGDEKHEQDLLRI